MRETKIKTIFILLYSLPVFRNLFLFPGCFFDQACELTRTGAPSRFVFIVPQKSFQKYAPIFSGKLSDRIVLESVQDPEKIGTLGKIFRFFYSYLIYTSTTKLLATMGTRPDEMPPGSRHLWPFKAFIANTFGRSRFMKTRIIPLVFNAIFNKNYFSVLFDKYHPDAVFLPHMLGWLDNLLLREAKSRGVKTIGMAANWDHIDKYFIPLQADLLLAQNELIKSAAIRDQAYQENRIRLTGYPHFDFIWSKKYLMERSDFLASQHAQLPMGAKYFLYISGSVYCPDEPDVIEEILNWISAGRFGPDVYMVIRPYLGGRFKDRDFDDNKFASFAKHYNVRMASRESWKDVEDTIPLLNFMAHASVVMSAFSTAALEASLFDRPLIGIGFDGRNKRPLHRSVRRFENFTHFQDIFKTGAVKVVRGFDELYAALDAYLENPGLDREKRELMRRIMCYKLDGRASERLLTAILNN